MKWHNREHPLITGDGAVWNEPIKFRLVLNSCWYTFELRKGLFWYFSVACDGKNRGLQRPPRASERQPCSFSMSRWSRAQSFTYTLEHGEESHQKMSRQCQEVDALQIRRKGDKKKGQGGFQEAYTTLNKLLDLLPSTARVLRDNSPLCPAYHWAIG